MLYDMAIYPLALCFYSLDTDYRRSMTGGNTGDDVIGVGLLRPPLLKVHNKISSCGETVVGRSSLYPKAV